MSVRSSARRLPEVVYNAALYHAHQENIVHLSWANVSEHYSLILASSIRVAMKTPSDHQIWLQEPCLNRFQLYEHASNPLHLLRCFLQDPKGEQKPQ